MARKMQGITVEELYNLEETIGSKLLEGVTYPWEALPLIGNYIKELGKTLDEKEYEKIGRKISRREYKEVEKYMYTLGLENGYIQDLGEHEEEYVPKFNLGI